MHTDANLVFMFVYVHEVHVFTWCQMLYLIIFAETCNRMLGMYGVASKLCFLIRKGAYNDQGRSKMAEHRELSGFINVWKVNSGGCGCALNHIGVYSTATVKVSLLSPYLC